MGGLPSGLIKYISCPPLISSGTSKTMPFVAPRSTQRIPEANVGTRVGATPGGGGAGCVGFVGGPAASPVLEVAGTLSRRGGYRRQTEAPP